MPHWKKGLASLFILFMFASMLRVHMPLDKKYFSTFYRPIDKVLSFTSTYQDWMMFAPDPMAFNFYLEARAHFDDGTTDSYFFPRSSNLGMIERYVYGEKFRKIVTDGIRKDSNSFLWDDAARFALRKLKDKHHHRIPLKVELVRNWYDLKKPTEEFIPHRTFATPEKFKSFSYYTYEVIK